MSKTRRTFSAEFKAKVALEGAQGGKFRHGFFAGAFTAGLAPEIMGSLNTTGGRVLASAVIGGTASVLGGGKFVKGAITGAFVMLFNHMRHEEEQPEDQKIPELDMVVAADKTRVEITIPNDPALEWGHDNGIPDALGPSLIALGYPLDALKPVGALGSTPGSSIASKTLRKVLPYKIPGGLKLFGTRGLGAAIGRAVPIAGWIITGLDIATTPHPMISTPNGWTPSFAPVDNTRVVNPRIRK